VEQTRSPEYCEVVRHDISYGRTTRSCYGVVQKWQCDGIPEVEGAGTGQTSTGEYHLQSVNVLTDSVVF
jgi:hypothetical protein